MALQSNQKYIQDNFGVLKEIKAKKCRLERIRRQRINEKLEKLKIIIMKHLGNDIGFYPPIEKADILELAIRCLEGKENKTTENKESNQSSPRRPLSKLNPNTPQGNTPTRNTPPRNIPLEYISPQNTPLQNTSPHNSPLRNTPPQNTPMEYTPAQKAGTEYTLPRNPPLQNTPLQRTLSNDTPSSETTPRNIKREIDITPTRVWNITASLEKDDKMKLTSSRVQPREIRPLLNHPIKSFRTFSQKRNLLNNVEPCEQSLLFYSSPPKQIWRPWTK